MSRLAGLPVLTAAEMRAAEEAVIAAGGSVEALMERAGAGVAQWAARLASGAPILILCGPGNNGGDGYVAARVLREGGADVKVAALGEPRSGGACAAAARWSGPTVPLAKAQPAPVLVDALFGTGPVRKVDGASRMSGLSAAARLRIGVDLPSGLDADLAIAPEFLMQCDATLALGALKPAHLLQPGASHCGEVRLIDLGLAQERDARTRVIDTPSLAPPDALTHKYSRGRVTVVAGAMPGAATLCAIAALRAGAGYVSIDGAERPSGPAALVHRGFDAAVLRGQRDGAIVVGPGLGRDDAARRKLAAALDAKTWLVIDGDALRLIDPDGLPWHCVLTPHSGEFDAVFGASEGSKIDRTRAAAVRAGCIVVHKGPDTVIAAPDGRVAIGEPGSSWLATAGSGDVLAGTIAARVARMGIQTDPADDPAIQDSTRRLQRAACDGVWMHAEATRLLGGGFIADDLLRALSLVQGMTR